FQQAVQARRERVAQAVEHVTFNHGVEGSSPSALTKLFNGLGRIPHVTKKRRAACLFLLCVGFGICSSVAEGQEPEASPQPDEAALLAGIRTAITDSHFGP